MTNATNYPSVVYINGEIFESAKANVSVFDRGFLFGDGIYEVMVQINGRFFYESAHLRRLQNCLDQINIPLKTDSLCLEINKLLLAADLVSKDCLLYIQVTRGVAPRQHAFPQAAIPTVMMYAIPKILPAINNVHAKVVTAQDFRWSRCDIKSISLLGNVLLNETAMRQQCYETLLLRDGVVTEASHCNVFFVKNGVVYTHPANEMILDGITRQITLQICDELNIKVRQAGIPKAAISSMHEAFLTGTSTQIASIKQIDSHCFYHGEALGEVTQRIQEAFLSKKLQGTTELDQ